MTIAKHSVPNHFSAGDLAYIIDHNFPVSQLTALLCRIESSAENGKVACEGLAVVNEHGSPCTFSHNDKSIMSVINRAGKKFKADQSILHPIS